MYVQSVPQIMMAVSAKNVIW